MCSCYFVLCAVLSQCYVHVLDCVMFSLQSQPSLLRSEHASLRSVGRMHACTYSKLVKTKVGVQISWGGLSSKQPMRYRHICIYIYTHIHMYESKTLMLVIKPVKKEGS